MDISVLKYSDQGTVSDLKCCRNELSSVFSFIGARVSIYYNTDINFTKLKLSEEKKM